MARSVQFPPNVKIDARAEIMEARRRLGSLIPRARVGALELGVLHGTVSSDVPGPRDLQGIIDYWKTKNAGGLAHAIVDLEGNSAFTVDTAFRAPHVGTMNGVSVGIEIVSNVGWLSRLYWRPRTVQLHETARWIAGINLVYGLPIREAVVTKAGDVTTTGWTTHRVLGQLGLGTDHTDPGPFFPMRKVLEIARWYRANGWEDGTFNPPGPVV